jgi:hypothetical protein
MKVRRIQIWSWNAVFTVDLQCFMGMGGGAMTLVVAKKLRRFHSITLHLECQNENTLQTLYKSRAIQKNEVKQNHA